MDFEIKTKTQPFVDNNGFGLDDMHGKELGRVPWTELLIWLQDDLMDNNKMAIDDWRYIAASLKSLGSEIECAISLHYRFGKLKE